MGGFKSTFLMIPTPQGHVSEYFVSVLIAFFYRGILNPTYILTSKVVLAPVSSTK
jgi:hypothetical protein